MGEGAYQKPKKLKATDFRHLAQRTPLAHEEQIASSE